MTLDAQIRRAERAEAERDALAEVLREIAALPQSKRAEYLDTALEDPRDRAILIARAALDKLGED